jgi:hypothetical protein
VILGPGSWTLTVSTRDSLACEQADDATCAALSFEVTSRPSQGLVHHWNFEDGLVDSVSGLEGTLMGNAALVEPDEPIEGDQGLEVNGNADHVLIPDAPTLRFAATDSYTVTAWVRPTGGGGWRGVVTKGREQAPWYGIWINPGDSWIYGTQPNNLASPTLVELDVWTHVAIVQDGSAGTRILYLNGEFAAENTAFEASSPTPLFLGGAGGVTEWFVGQIDDVRVYDEGLDQDGVLESMEPIDTTPPGALFRRGDVDGNGLVDLTDPINNLSFQFLGEFVPTCLDALDFDDSGAIDVSDPVGNLSAQFLGSAPAPAPGSSMCGPDPTEDTLDCAEQPGCAAQ